MRRAAAAADGPCISALRLARTLARPSTYERPVADVAAIAIDTLPAGQQHQVDANHQVRVALTVLQRTCGRLASDERGRCAHAGSRHSADACVRLGRLHVSVNGEAW